MSSEMRIAHLDFMGLPSWWDQGIIVSLINIGIDETGYIDEQGEMLAVCAYIGPTSHVTKFTREWNFDLEKYGVAFSHAKDLNNKKSGVFKHLSNNKRKELVKSLVGHIQKRMEWGLCAYGRADLYKKITTHRFRSQYGSLYTFAIRQILMHVAALQKRENRMGEPINILIEKGHRNEKQALDAVAIYREVAHKHLNIAFCDSAPKKGYPILQASDLLAFAMCERLRNDTPSFMAILANARRPEHYEVDCNSAVLTQFKESIASIYKTRKLQYEEKKRNIL